MSSNDASHDWYHVERVWNTAKAIASTEKVDILVVELAALLHDITDRKYFKGTKQEGRELIQGFLKTLALSSTQNGKILSIIEEMSFSKEGNITCSEQQVVQDADRLDAIGAIGIARCMYYAAVHDNPMHIPGLLGEHESISAYKRHGSSTAISHFYDKLLKVKDTMLTKKGQEIAKYRHSFLQSYLDQFLSEWEGIK